VAREHIFEIPIIQSGNPNQGDEPLGLGNRITKVFIRCASTSTGNVWVGWNGRATSANTLQPTESVGYEAQDGNYLDGNNLYIGFDPTLSGGQALVTIHTVVERSEADC
jgi:hypothetical protein